MSIYSESATKTRGVLVYLARTLSSVAGEEEGAFARRFFASSMQTAGLLPSLQAAQREVRQLISVLGAPEEGSEQPSPPLASVAAQAKNLVQQVRQAIQTISTSSEIANPQAPRLRAALKRLQPLLDQLIHAVEAADGDGSRHRQRRHPLWGKVKKLRENPR